MTITSKPSFTTADGSVFPDRKTAQAYQDTCDRVVRLTALFDSGETPASQDPIYSLATLGQKLIDAMTLPSRMGRKPKAPAAAA